MIRITADLDNISLSTAGIRVLAVLNLLFKNGFRFNDKIIRLSPRKKGVHVILWTNQLLDKKQIFFIRSLLGDDYERLSRDKKRRRPKQYLFKSKHRLKKNHSHILMKKV